MVFEYKFSNNIIKTTAVFEEFIVRYDRLIIRLYWQRPCYYKQRSDHSQLVSISTRKLAETLPAWNITIHFSFLCLK